MKKKKELILGSRTINEDSKPYIIAEIGVNHEGSLEKAKELINLAKEGGADAVKFQTYKAEKLASKNSPAYWDIKEEATKSQFKLFKKYDSFEKSDYLELYEHSKGANIDFLSTPFDLDSIDFLDELVPFFKVASADINNLPFLRKIASKTKPVVISTGASNIDEINFAIKVFNFLNFELGYLHLYNFYFIFYLSAISSMLNFFLSLIYCGRKYEKDKWLFLGDIDKFNKLNNEVIQSNLNIIIDSFSNNYLYDPFNFKYKGIIIDKDLTLDKNNLSSLKNLKNKGIDIINLTNWCGRYLERFPIDLIDEDRLIQDIAINKSSMQFRIKRLGDISISIILLFFSIPIFIICSSLIYLEDRGPIFYKQIRTGRYEKHFQIIKLRTMMVNAENSGPQWSKCRDKRITKVGKILRITRIDELPQLISVLKGEMSLIGPRPERPEIDKQLKYKIPNYSLRYTIKPGLSGWAQVNFPYGASISDSIDKFSFDIYYLKYTSVLLDFLICIRTIRMVFNARGATPKTN